MGILRLLACVWSLCFLVNCESDATLLHAVDVHREMDRFFANLRENSLPGEKVIRFHPENRQTLFQAASEGKATLLLVYRFDPSSDRLFFSGSSPDSPWLTSGQTHVLQRARHLISSGIDSFPVDDLGHLPLPELTRMSIPTLTLFVPKAFDQNHLTTMQAGLRALGPVVISRVLPTPVDPVEAPLVKEEEEVVQAPPPPRSEEEIRREVMSWITLETDDESWMQAFEPFRQPPAPVAQAKSSASTAALSSSPALTHAFLDDSSMLQLTQELLRMSLSIKSNEALSEPVLESVTNADQETVEPPFWLVGP